MGISDELGGYVTITVAVIIITGIIGNVLAETICRVFKIEESVAKELRSDPPHMHSAQQRHWNLEKSKAR